MEWLNASLTQVAAGLAAGHLGSVELTAACLQRAHRLQARLNCFIHIDDERAMQQARAADAARGAGRRLGALHGVPLAHKDMYYEVDRITHCAGRVRPNFVASQTSTLLQRLNAAGAVNLGALNMTEFAFGPTGHNAVWGDCHNPWHPERISCGSSSGSGAATAARIVYGSLGSDTGGSIRLPAAANGVVGLKPTYSRLSRAASMGLSFSTDTPGPLARTAADVARLMSVIEGGDPADPLCSTRPAEDYESVVGSSVDGQRLGIPSNYFFDLVTPDINCAVQEALRALVSLGARLVEVKVPVAENLGELSRVLVYSEASARHGEWLRERPDSYSRQVRIRAAAGIAIPAAAYVEALHLRASILRRFVTEVFTHCDVLLTPTLGVPVPTLSETNVGGGAEMWDIIGKLVHCTAGFNYLGLPALSIPIGFDCNELPVGLQLIGRPFSEAYLLGLADAYQRVTDWHLRVPPALA